MSEHVRINIADARPAPTGFRPWRDAAPTPAPAPAEPTADSFAEGLAEGQRLAEELFALERQSLLRLIEGLEVVQPEPSEELAALIALSVERLVTDIVGTCTIDVDHLRRRARAAADLVGEADRCRVLHLHPADLALLRDAALDLQLQPDADLARGDFRLACSNGWVEDGVTVHLDRLRVALGVPA